jgi:exopolysaccharide biosynthesis polyprenyl glycosylphosphotransferase
MPLLPIDERMSSMSTLLGDQKALAGIGYAVTLTDRTVVIPASPQSGVPAVAKRMVDLGLGLVALIALSPFFLAISVLICLESGWPVFFRQKRLGLGGEEFTVYKFRSMSKDAERLLPELQDNNEIKDGPIFKWRNDPRITKVGRILRRSSLDELPQLLNVMFGQMSLVGPRPPLESEVAKYEEWHLRRLSVKPGMTGLWQVSGRSDLTFGQMVQLDIRYVENWSVWMDLALLVRTPIAVLVARGAF